jgi:UDP-N-acetyl-D-mannosaminuronate dehydrogenase
LLFEHGTTETIPEILKASMKVNNQKEESVFSEIIAKTKILKKKGILNPEIIIMGLAYKDNTKHLQGSVALRIARKLNKKDALKVKVFDPNIPAEDIEKFNLIRKNIQPGAFVNADIIAILVGHREFYQMTMDCHFLIDPCGVMPKQKKKSVLKKIVDFITTGASQSAKK